jgi:hypothetical protein
MALPIWARQIARGINANSPTIMSGLAVAGVITTAVLAVRATPEAYSALVEEWDNPHNGVDVITERNKIPLKKKVSVTWKFYIPAAVSGAATIALIIGSNRVGVRRQVAMAGAYTLLDTAFRNYKDEVLEQVGVAKEQRVRDGIQKKQMDTTPVVDSQVILVGGGDQLCFESLSGRYFKSDVEGIRRAANDINAELINHAMYYSLNEWFDYLGLEHTELGDILGFNIERKVDVFFTAHLASNGEPCLAIGYKHHPFREFGEL